MTFVIHAEASRGAADAAPLLFLFGGLAAVSQAVPESAPVLRAERGSVCALLHGNKRRHQAALAARMALGVSV